MSYNTYAYRRVHRYSKDNQVELNCRSVEHFYFPDFVVKVCQPSPEHIENSTSSDVYVAGCCNSLQKFLRKKLYKPTQLTEDDLFIIRHCIRQIGHHREISLAKIKKGIEKSIAEFGKLCNPHVEEPESEIKEDVYFEVTA